MLERKSLMGVKIESPADIARLPWAGNFADDEPLFLMIKEYIRREPALAKRQEASELATWHGMGIKEKCPPEYDPREY